MRVLMVSHAATVGGSNGTVSELLTRAPAGTECAWLFLEDGPLTERSPVPWAVVEAGRAREAWRAPAVIRSIRGAIRALEADLVFAHITKAHIYASVAARLEGVPYLWWQQERVGQKPLLHELSGRLPAGAVICSADHTAAEQLARWPGTPVVRIHLGAPAERVPKPREHGPTADPVIGVVGRLQRWKRVELAIRALPAVREQVPGARLRVVGDALPGVDDDYPDELRRLASDLAVDVEFTGEVPDGLAAIAELDVFAHCAELEPFGLAPVEAMLSGVPVVVPDEGGPRESVRDGVDGLRVDPTDTPAFAAALARLAGDWELRKRMGAAGRARALECFTAERMAEQAWDVAERVARDGRL